jgi:hypothetical protein
MAQAPYRFLAEGSTNKKEVRSGDGQVTSIIAANLSAAVKYLKLYNSATSPNLASATPIATFALPANDTRSFQLSLDYSKGLWHAITLKGADTNEEAVTAGDVSVTITTR